MGLNLRQDDGEGKKYCHPIPPAPLWGGIVGVMAHAITKTWVGV